MWTTQFLKHNINEEVVCNKSGTYAQHNFSNTIDKSKLVTDLALFPEQIEGVGV
jgi:hypothetical protein